LNESARDAINTRRERTHGTRAKLQALALRARSIVSARTPSSTTGCDDAVGAPATDRNTLDIGRVSLRVV